MPERPVASPLVTLGIPSMALLTAVLFVLAVAASQRGDPTARRAWPFALVGTVVWLALAGALAYAGVLARFEARPPPIMPFIAAVFALGIGLGVSRLGGRIATALPLAALVGVQAFRLPLELIMHRAAVEHVMPPQMTYTGLNFDIVTGALAVPIGVLVWRGRAPLALVRAWNTLGMLTLAVVVTIAATSMPMIAAFGRDAAHVNTWVARFPFVYLPAGPVVFALAGHIVVARRLRAERARVNA